MKQIKGVGLVLAVLLGTCVFSGEAEAFSYQGLTTVTGSTLEMPEKKSSGKPSAAQAASPAKESQPVVKEEKTMATVEEKMRPIDGRPMDADDFTFHGVALGDSAKVMIGLEGKPDAIHRGNLKDNYVWQGLQVSAYSDFLSKYMNRKDLPVDQVIPKKGISDIYIHGGDFTTQRGICIGSRRENVLRLYGRPDEVLWDGEKKSFYLLYSGYRKELSFQVANDKVVGIHLGWKEEKAEGLKRGYKDIYNHNFLPEKDFSLAGLSLHTPFTEYSFSEWEKKMANPKEEIVYYPGYAVRMTKQEKMVCALFLTDSRMVTSRGLAMGDSASTAELLYGAPHKLEMDASDGVPRTAYVYFSRAKDKVLLMYLKDKKVDGIVVAENPQKKK